MAFLTGWNFQMKKFQSLRITFMQRIDKLIESGQKECAIELFNIWERRFSLSRICLRKILSLRFSYYSEVEGL